jgi:hypothetical protein
MQKKVLFSMFFNIATCISQFGEFSIPAIHLGSLDLLIAALDPLHRLRIACFE